MTDYPLTKPELQLLTEFVEEEWYEPNDDFERLIAYGLDSNMGRRTFLTGNDAFLLKDKLVKEGLWDEFMELAFDSQTEASPQGSWVTVHNKKLYYNDQFIVWLFTMPRFAYLVAHCPAVIEYMKKKEK